VTFCKEIISERTEIVHDTGSAFLSTFTIPEKFTHKFRIIDETPDLIVVDKPPFLQVHPSKPSEKRTLWHELRNLLAFEIVNGGQVSLINRLDRETSGLTLVAKSQKAARDLGIQMQNRTIEKSYQAIVWGWPNDDEWINDAPILRQGTVRASPIYLKQIVHPSGATAWTRFRVQRRVTRKTVAGEKFSLVTAFPSTGRMHQIRVHLAHSGHAIVGDKIYGPDENCYLEFIQTGWTPLLADRLLLPRHALHSSFMMLTQSGKSWQSPLPCDLRTFVEDGDGR
jgi:23S rRNA pseudouridine1911/1915/1917 synthase